MSRWAQAKSFEGSLLITNQFQELNGDLTKSRELNVTKFRKLKCRGNLKWQTAGKGEIHVKMYIIEQKSCDFLP